MQETDRNGNVRGYTYDADGNVLTYTDPLGNTTTYTYDETNRMVRGTNEKGEVSGYTYNGLGVRVGTELILEDNSHGYTDFHCQTPSVETGIETPEVVHTDDSSPNNYRFLLTTITSGVLSEWNDKLQKIKSLIEVSDIQEK